MEGKIHVNADLDYAVFQISSTQNRYEAIVCSKGRTEKLAYGSLDQLALHLPEAKGVQSNMSNGTFKLQLGEKLKVSWFTKSTLARFLHFVDSPEVLKSSNAMLSEISQLEETRKFHLALYLKDRPTHLGSGLTGGFLQDVRLAHQVNVDTVSSDPTKNELLRALDLRLMTLKEETVVSLNRAAGSNLSKEEISDISAFAAHFGALDLRNSLLKYLAIISDCQSSEPSYQPSMVSNDSNEKCESATEICQPKPQTDILYSTSNSVSPAKLAQIERHSSSESEESSELSDEDQAVVERSRPIVRSASPRRSASPMRRVQIGRSGSRRSTAITIKSLNYYPARERMSLNRDADETNSCNEESEQPSRKPESTVRRMSVQDAINLFESKQKDQNLDAQKRRASGEAATNINKTVLRRWSSGMGDSFTHRSQENTADTASLNTSISLVPEEEKKIVEVMVDSDPQLSNLVLPEVAIPHVDAHVATPSEPGRMLSPPMSVSTDLIKPKPEENGDGLTLSAEWNRQKEAELNQMLMKMMGNKPVKYKGTNAITNGLVDSSGEQKGDFYSQYKEKRDEKLRCENVRKRAAKEAKFKVLHETLEKSKAQMVSKTSGTIEKHVSPIHSQRPRRNSSPPVLPKKDVSKTPARKASSKLSPLPASRSSGSSGPSPKANGSQLTKSIPRTISTNTPPNQRKKQTAPTQPSARTERPLQQQKNKKGTVMGGKQDSKGQEEKKLKPVTKTSRRLKTGNSPDLGDESGLTATKPSFYNKVTKKSSVVPLESKPFLRKGNGSGPGVGPVSSKSKAPQPVDSPKGSESQNLAEDKESSVVKIESTSKVLEVDLAQPENDVDTNLEILLDNDCSVEKTENLEQSLAPVDSSVNKSIEPPAAEIQPDEDMDISSTAWVEADHQEIPTTCERGLMTDAVSPGIAPISSSSPRIHHSLSQMLQADTSESEIIEWGNAENPPALVYQKDAPKGLKRLLKFARKSKGDANVTGWASPSTFSEGEDDQEESRGANKKSLDLLSRKVVLQAKGFGQSFDSGNSSKRAVDHHKMHSILPAQPSGSSLSSLSDKLHEGQASVTANPTKTSRSFFSLSTFRSSKSSDSKPR
ncbi:uncharacterized protein [Typha latifolia]|uniref:uncharacterized protein n=1 Tax=Typha latifolia TaxID=4733 RepID=UPI003C2B3644